MKNILNLNVSAILGRFPLRTTTFRGDLGGLVATNSLETLVNKPLIRTWFLGWVAPGGRLTSHDDLKWLPPKRLVSHPLIGSVGQLYIYLHVFTIHIN